MARSVTSQIGLQEKLPQFTKSGWRVPAHCQDGDAMSVLPLSPAANPP
jgi:hypothetical protein